MGIRIHRVMGYGLTDVTAEDPRINWDSPVFAWDEKELTFEAEMRKSVDAAPLMEEEEDGRIGRAVRKALAL